MKTQRILTIIQILIIGSMNLFSGCSTTQQLALKHFENNDLLEPEEKTYAKRCLLFMYNTYKLEDNSKFTPQMLESKLYEKWGLGPRREFNAAETAYIVNIDNFMRAWDIYNNLDMDNLSPSEKEYLQTVHRKYGPTPSFEDYMSVGKEFFFHGDVEFHKLPFEMVKSLFNIDRADDFSIILMSRLEKRCVI